MGALAPLNLNEEIIVDLDSELDRLRSCAEACHNNKADRIRWRDLRARWESIAKHLEAAAKEISTISDVEYDLLDGLNPWDWNEDLDERIERKHAETDASCSAERSFVERSHILNQRKHELFPLTDERHFAEAAERADNSSIPFDERLRFAALLFRHRIQMGKQLGLDGPGAGDLKARLHQPASFTFIAECSKEFLRHGLLITDSESGSFFNFCREIWESAEERGELQRDRSFRNLVETTRRIDTSKARISELWQSQDECAQRLSDESTPYEEVQSLHLRRLEIEKNIAIEMALFEADKKLIWGE